uniref:3-hydroxyanthranilate 3,4-dioxygenase n=1 Tax=Romanomermis culicivorax TaxID=13658 RepID=A0A915KK21_ROMCU
MALQKHNVSQWIEENKVDFVPPVCNKCLFSNQLKAFLVGGPNVRKDFHLEEGEEFFYMLEGDMCLRTVNNGVVKDIEIKEGQLMVVECANKYFHDEKTLAISFERWFHLEDAVADLPPIISDYFRAKEEGKLIAPKIDSNVEQRPYAPNDQAVLEKPVHLMEWIKDNAINLEKNFLQLYGAPRFKSTVRVYGPRGEFSIEAHDGEVFVWYLTGCGIITTDKPEPWKAVECCLIKIGKQAKITTETDSYFLAIKMPTPKK